MFSFMNLARTALSKLVVFIYSFISFFATGLSQAKDLPKVPDDFTPVVRFAVCSDVHINGQKFQAEPERFKKMVNTAYAYAENEEYKNLDAVCVAGDFTDAGKKEQYEVFNACVKETFKEGTQLLICAGNHEYIDCRESELGAEAAVPVYKEMLSRELDEHNVINGYHFITVSYDSNGRTFTGKKKWLNNEIKAAIKDTGDKPVFVFQHPAPFGTIYGSMNWGDFSVAEVLTKYPQVVDFSGHSHYPMNDPRSIWQGTFTAFGSGTLSYYETELDYIAGNYPYDSHNAAQFYIVEADKDGNVRVQCYDLITNSFFGLDYYLTGLADRNFDYSFNKMKARDNAPEFSNDMKISTKLDKDGNTVLEFDGAKGNFVVESYKISLAKDGIIPVADDEISGKYMYIYMDDTYSVNFGKLKSGEKYVAEIVAFNAYSEASKPLRYTFTAE